MSGPELRQFGLLFGTIVALIFVLLLPFIVAYSFPLWPWVGASVFATSALLAPTALTPFYRRWMRFGLIAAFINTRIIIFVLCDIRALRRAVCTHGACHEVIWRDALARTTRVKTTESYHVASAARPNDHFERPY